MRFLSYDQFKHMLADAEVSGHHDRVARCRLMQRRNSGKGHCTPESRRYAVRHRRVPNVLLTLHTAGLGAGMMEAIFAVTPSETIK